jgi:hypothetical protein
MLVGPETEVLDSLSSVLGSSEEECVASSRSSQCQLIQSQSLSTSSEDARTSSCSEAKCGNAELGNSQKTVVVGDSANNNDGLIIGLLRSVGNNSRNRDRRSVDTGHEKATKNNLVERGFGPAWVEGRLVSMPNEMVLPLMTYELRSDRASRAT